jgi:hypothetical protein
MEGEVRIRKTDSHLQWIKIKYLWLSSYYCISSSTIIIQIWEQFRRHHCIKRQEAVLYVIDLFLHWLITLNLKGEMYAINFFFTPFHTSMMYEKSGFKKKKYSNERTTNGGLIGVQCHNSSKVFQNTTSYRVRMYVIAKLV